jgi:histidine triad (HIT) family protein
MSECVFCRIINNKSANDLVYQDEHVTAFKDRHPAAPVHLLIVPNKHITSVNDLQPEDENLVGHMFLVAQKLAAEKGIVSSGYRLVINTGPDAGQAVFHLHLHMLGGMRIHHFIG